MMVMPRHNYSDDEFSKLDLCSETGVRVATDDRMIYVSYVVGNSI